MLTFVASRCADSSGSGARPGAFTAATSETLRGSLGGAAWTNAGEDGAFLEGVVERKTLLLLLCAGADTARTSCAARDSSSSSSPLIVRGHSANLALGLPSFRGLPSPPHSASASGIGRKKAPPGGGGSDGPPGGELAMILASSTSKSSPLSVRGQNIGFGAASQDGEASGLLAMPFFGDAPAIMCCKVSPLIVLGQSCG